MEHTAGFLKLVNEAKSRVKQTDIAGYREMLAHGENPLLVDVREDNEWAAAHAAGATHLGKGVLERDIERLCRIRARRWCSIAGVDTVPRWPRMRRRKWDIRT